MEPRRESTEWTPCREDPPVVDWAWCRDGTCDPELAELHSHGLRPPVETPRPDLVKARAEGRTPAMVAPWDTAFARVDPILRDRDPERGLLLSPARPGTILVETLEALRTLAMLHCKTGWTP